MPGTLTFLVDDTLKAVVAHARSSAVLSPNLVELYDPACRKDGKEPDEGVFPTADDVDPAKLQRGLWLVKDRGVYVMSPGNPGLDDPSGKGSLVAYAVEANPKDEDCWDSARRIMGGDDGVDKIPLETFERAIAENARAVLVMVSATSLRFHVRP